MENKLPRLIFVSVNLEMYFYQYSTYCVMSIWSMQCFSCSSSLLTSFHIKCFNKIGRKYCKLQIKLNSYYLINLINGLAAFLNDLLNFAHLIVIFSPVHKQILLMIGFLILMESDPLFSSLNILNLCSKQLRWFSPLQEEKDFLPFLM